MFPIVKAAETGTETFRATRYVPAADGEVAQFNWSCSITCEQTRDVGVQICKCFIIHLHANEIMSYDNNARAVSTKPENMPNALDSSKNIAP